MKKTTKKNHSTRPRTLKEAGDFYEAHKGDVSLWLKKPVKAKVVTSAGGSIVFSLRFSASELEDLRLQADARGITLSEMIRKAALDWGQSRRYQVVVQPQPNVEVSIARTRSLAKATSEVAELGGFSQVWVAA